ncbi:hypothetical protein GW17_00048584 [Ensete ventricosum]|nr:hypothetical protein GW17_00048584 [Ensete ventricosum]
MEEGMRATKKNNNKDPNFLSKTNESGQGNPEKPDLSNDSQKAMNQTIRTRAPTPRTRNFLARKGQALPNFLYRFVIRSFEGLGKGQTLGEDGSGGEKGWDLGKQRGGNRWFYHARRSISPTTEPRRVCGEALVAVSGVTDTSTWQSFIGKDIDAVRMSDVELTASVKEEVKRPATDHITCDSCLSLKWVRRCLCAEIQPSGR